MLEWADPIPGKGLVQSTMKRVVVLLQLALWAHPRGIMKPCPSPTSMEP